MAIITFCSNEMKETGQTLSVATIASYMGIAHNYKILVVSTNFNDLTLENCFWEYEKIRPTGAIKKDSKNIDLDSGIEGLLKVLGSNRTSTEIVKNYSRIVLRDRLDILLSPVTKSYQEYMNITHSYVNVLQTANRYYDLVLVDLCKRIPKEDASSILKISDVVVMNITQRLKAINNFMALRDANDFYKRRNVMIAIGRYDRFSKYNKKNVARYLKEKKEPMVIPYNTLLFEACSEGTIIDFILKIRHLEDDTDRNFALIQELQQIDKSISYKLEELQMKM